MIRAKDVNLKLGLSPPGFGEDYSIDGVIQANGRVELSVASSIPGDFGHHYDITGNIHADGRVELSVIPSISVPHYDITGNIHPDGKIVLSATPSLFHRFWGGFLKQRYFCNGITYEIIGSYEDGRLRLTARPDLGEAPGRMYDITGILTDLVDQE